MRTRFSAFPAACAALALLAGSLRALPDADLGPSGKVSAASAWPTFKGDNARDGRGPSLGLPVSRQWSVRLEGPLYSSPAVVDGRVYLGSSAKLLYCLDLGTGKTLWRRILPDRVWGSSPALAGSRVFIGCVDGCVYASDASDGSPRGAWCAAGGGWMDTRDVLSSPLVEGARLVFGSDDRSIYGMDLDGGPDWSVPTGDKLHDNGAAEEAGMVVMPSRDAMVRALALSDGSARWTFKAGGAFNTVPALDAERAYLGCADGKLYALNLADGSLAWTYTTGRGVMSSPALGTDGSVVFGSSDGSVYCLDAATGARRWAFHTQGYVLSSPLITGSLVWIGSYDGRFYVLGLADGRQRWSMAVFGGVFASPACADGRILVAGRNGSLTCLKAAPL